MKAGVKMIKLIAADMDGTLVGSDRRISPENIKAIKSAQERGIKFAIATGRALCDVIPMLKEYDLKCDTLIMNGAEYLDEEGKIIESTYIGADRVQDILKAMKHEDLLVEIYTDDGFYTEDTKEEVLEGMIRRARISHPQLKAKRSEEIVYAKKSIHFQNMKYIKNLDEFIKDEKHNIAKFVSFAENAETINKLREKVKALGGLAVSGSFPTNIEVNHIDAEKGKILAKVIRNYHIGRDQVAVIGDGMNDYSMFEEFSCSFAMRNAVPEIKEAARFITDSNNESGVAKAIYRIIEEKL